MPRGPRPWPAGGAVVANAGPDAPARESQTVMKCDEQTLARLLERAPWIEGAILVGREGLPIGWRAPRATAAEIETLADIGVKLSRAARKVWRRTQGSFRFSLAAGHGELLLREMEGPSLLMVLTSTPERHPEFDGILAETAEAGGPWPEDDSMGERHGEEDTRAARVAGRDG